MKWAKTTRKLFSQTLIRYDLRLYCLFLSLFAFFALSRSRYFACSFFYTDVPLANLARSWHFFWQSIHYVQSRPTFLFSDWLQSKVLDHVTKQFPLTNCAVFIVCHIFFAFILFNLQSTKSVSRFFSSQVGFCINSIWLRNFYTIVDACVRLLIFNCLSIVNSFCPNSNEVVRLFSKHICSPLKKATDVWKFKYPLVSLR